MNRAVVRDKSKLEPQGATLHLACGHRMWHAGLKYIPASAECLISPCYRPQVAMGNDQ